MFAIIRNSRAFKKLTEITPKMVNMSRSLATMPSAANIKQDFEMAQHNLKKLNDEPPNDVKLRLYALYKQAVVGPCNAPKPSPLDMVGRAKWGSWSALGSMSNAEAMAQYIDTVNLLLKDSGVQIIEESGTGPQPEILVENRNGVQVITLNRPRKFNAISVQMYEQWIEALNKANADESIKMGLITGKGDYFSSGNDLKNFEQGYVQFKGDIKTAAQESAKVLQRFVAAFIDFDKPLIAAVNGPAIGIAVTTLGLVDCAIASDSATFQSPFSALGQSPEACATYTFPRIMGYSKASEMLLFNHKMTAEEALTCGLVSRVIPSRDFRSFVEEWVFGPTGLAKTCFPKSMYFSKSLVKNQELKNKLHEVNKQECDVITDRWTSDECLQALQKFSTRKSNL